MASPTRTDLQIQSVTQPLRVGSPSLQPFTQKVFLNRLLSYLQLETHERSNEYEEELIKGIFEQLLNSSVTVTISDTHIGDMSIDDILEALPGSTLDEKRALFRLMLTFILTAPCKKEFSNDFDVTLEHFFDLFDPDPIYKQDIKRLIEDLYDLYTKEPSMQAPWKDWEGNSSSFRWIKGDDSNNAVISFYRYTEEGKHLLFFHHFGSETIESYHITFPVESYFPYQNSVRSVKEIHHSDYDRYLGDKTTTTPITMTTADADADTGGAGFRFQITPYSSIIFELDVSPSTQKGPITVPPVPSPCDAFGSFVSEKAQNPGITISEKVKKQVESCITAHLKGEDTYTIHYGNNFSIKDLSPQELATFYYLLFSYLNYQMENNFQATKYAEPITNPQVTIFRILSFDVRDYCFRTAFQNKASGLEIIQTLRAINDPLLENSIRILEEISSESYPVIFRPLVDSDSLTSPIESIRKATFASPKVEREASDPRKLKVWKISHENSSNPIGGLGAVVRASYTAHRKMGLETVQSIHPLFSHDKFSIVPPGKENKAFTIDQNKYKFKGVVSHELKGVIVTSSVYKNKATGEYLIVPDIDYKPIFDVYSQKNVYGGFRFSNRIERYLYLASAAAVAAATYCGKDGTKSVDVLQADAWHSGTAAFMLITETLNQIRQEHNLSPLALVYLTHMLVEDLEEQGLVRPTHLKAIGLRPNTKEKTNLTAAGLTLSDQNIFVSHGVARDAVSEDKKLNKGLREPTLSGGMGKVLGITNGIDTSVFDVASSTAYGDYAVKNEEFRTAQIRTKQALFDAGIIADPSKPLVLFVGRYSHEKGIEMLPTIAEKVKECGGQIVIMGLYNNETDRPPVIKTLKALSADPAYKSVLRVYDERGDQMDPFKTNSDPGCTVRKGWLLRQASSIVVVPSFAEACGLVPLELQCAGAITIAPYHQGLRDMCIPCNSPNLTDGISYTLTPTTDGISDSHTAIANAFCYADCMSQSELCEAIGSALDTFGNLTEVEINEFMKRTHDYAIKHYDWAVIRDGIPVDGSAYKYSEVYHRVAHKKGQRSDIETFEQAVGRVMLAAQKKK